MFFKITVSGEKKNSGENYHDKVYFNYYMNERLFNL